MRSRSAGSPAGAGAPIAVPSGAVLTTLMPWGGVAHHPTARIVSIAPDPVHQLVPRKDDTGVAREGMQDLELQRGQPDLDPVDRDPPARGIEHEPGVFDRAVVLVRPHALQSPQDGLYARGELAEAERLRQVVVRPDGEPRDLVGL